MFLRLGSLPCVVISGAEVAEVVLNDPRFSHRSIETIMYSARYLEFDNQGFQSHYNEQLKLIRKLCTREIRTITRMEAFAKETKEDLHSSLQECVAHINQENLVCLPDILGSLGLNLMIRLLFGQRFHDSKGQVALKEFQDFRKALPQLIQLVAKFNLSDLFPAVRWLGIQGHVKVYKKVRAQMEAAFKSIFEENKLRAINNDGNSDSENFVSFLLAHQLSETSVMGALQDLIIGGSETFVGTTQWALAELVRNPDKLKRLQDEIDQKVGLSRPVEESDLINLPYLRACVRETLRVYTPVPLLIPRETTEGFTFKGYSILPKTTVLVTAWDVGRDPAAYKNPESFEPERWLESGRFSEVADGHFLAFGGGRRGCIGVKLGTVMAQMTLASLLHAFEWGPPPGIDCKDLDMSPTLGFFLVRKVGIKFSAAPRLDPRVYNLGHCQLTEYLEPRYNHS